MPLEPLPSAAEREAQGITLDAMLPAAATLSTIETSGQSLGIATLAPEGDVVGTAILVPGFTSSRSTFFCIMDQLGQAGFRVIALSQRGQPGSTGPDDPSGYSLDVLAHDLFAVAESFDIDEPVHLLGHSFGGIVGTAAVIHDPPRWASFTLWNSGARFMGAEAGLGEALEQLRAQGPRVLWVQDRISRGLDPDVDLRGEMNVIEKFYFDRLMGTKPAQLEAGLNILATQENRVSDLASSGVPLLVSHGDADDAWPIPQQREDASAMGAAYRVIPRAGHSAHQDNPSDSVETLTRFWDVNRAR